MKTKITFLALFLIAVNFGFAQNTQEECVTKTSIFHEYVKAKNFDAAYEPWMEVKAKCPKFSNAIYIDGEKILLDKIKKAAEGEKVGHINALLKLWEDRATYFPAKTPKGEFAAKACQLMYNHRKVLGKNKEELYKCFDAAYNLDSKTFTNPKSLYTYFSLMVDLYDAKKKTANDLFNKYDDIAEKVESEVKNYSLKLNKLIEKEEAGTALTAKEGRYKKFYSSYLKAYDQISGSIDAKLGDRANCENLIPLYTKDFEANKTNAVWLQRAAGKMSEKDCTGDPLFFKLVNAYHKLSPSANSAFYLGILKDKKGNSKEAITFYKQAMSLETDKFKKAKLANRIGLKLKARGAYGQARNYFRQSLKLNPSNGRPYLSIAAMYAASANKCGDTNFNKRAVYWLAAEEAKKAARVDATQKKRADKSIANYLAKAPGKSEIFSCGCSGQVIKIGCWIGASVTVPKI